ncbi:Glutamine dumper 3 [Rhynchospora pubera]|uniref:Glutamine dumper 3 n=1 Tax=Rhynchospora pubera TaxID=906938 RepID=A0AAV8CQI5_9POAL|nr:Glutamine dumper 3 [Rhynchospora pubera]
MRPGTTFSEVLRHPTSSPSPLASPDMIGLHPAWRSPVTYLFGGLAAMLGLIALALLTLACTYWRLTGYLNSVGVNREMNSHGGNGEGKRMDDGNAGAALPIKQHVAVIMAGEAKPTYLATTVQKKDVEDNCCNSSGDSLKNSDRNIVTGVETDLERGIGVPDGDRNQISIELNQQQLRRQ